MALRVTRKLSPREEQAVLLLAQGLTSAMAANRMGVSQRAVNRYAQFACLKRRTTRGELVKSLSA